MSKLLLMVGLPASGKTTKARELMVEYGNAVRLNRDELRAMLHTGEWSGKQEGITRDVQRTAARQLLLQNTGVVIIDDTNLHTGVIESWKALARETATQFELYRLDTPLAECLRRDALREKPVGRHVIVGMAIQYGLYPKPERGIVLCDIDGTLANVDHRRCFVQQEPKDWKGFHEHMALDTVRQDILEKVYGLWISGYEVIFVSGRPDNYRTATELWLLQACHWMEPVVFMRRADDHRPDTVVKKEMLTKYFPDKTWIHCVIDDRPSVIRMWRTEGLYVIDVGKGTEF